MQTFATITDARRGIRDFLATRTAGLPADVVSRIGDLADSPSPVDQIVRVGEYLYAERAVIGDDGRSLAGGLIGFATINAWHGLLDGDRGNGIVQGLRRDLGETPPAGMSWPAAAADPPPLPEFAPPAPAVAATPAT